jgi:hypothetical protein
MRIKPMNRRLRVGPAAVLGVLWLVAFSDLVAQRNARCVALVTEMRGGVLVKAARATEFKGATWGTQLYAGDVVKTSSNGSASILLSNNTLIELGSASSMIVSESRRTPQTQAKTISGMSSEPLTNLSGLTMRSTSEGEVVALAGLRALGAELTIVQTSPLKSKIRSSRPTFSWQSNVPADNFKVELFDNNGLVWSKETDRTTLEYPGSEKPLRRGGSYYWRVAGVGSADIYATERVHFSVIAETSLAVVERQERNLKELFSQDPASASHDFLAGTLYQQHDLLEESIAKFEAVAHRYPESPTIYEVLGKLYKDIGLKDKSIAALLKALELTQRGR